MSAHIHPAPPTARTLEDVARLAGVSRNTVSLVLRQSPLVKPETRERVLRVVGETGYRRNHAARILASQRTETIGLAQLGVSPLEITTFSGTIETGLHRALEEAGYDLLVLSAARRAEGFDLVEPVRSGRVDGLVAIGESSDRAAVSSAWAGGTKLVHIGRRDFGAVDVPYVKVDEAAGSDQAIRHLREHGHTRIAFVGEDLDFEPCADKLAAYRVSCRAAGLLDTSDLELELPLNAGDAVRPVVRRLVEAGATAAIVSRDVQAVDLIRGLREAGRRVPETFAVISYGNAVWTPLTEPPLTCIHMPRFELGLEAGRLVAELVEDRETSWPRAVPTSLVVRRSCGCSWDPFDEGRGLVQWPSR
jgi:LacI family transcriptional regulator, repressor for deo operon, udp, cdd, tsx, nupC, and nupG